MPLRLDLVDPLPAEHPGLKPDCERCCGLCCVAPTFVRSPDFALDKDAGRPCPHLTSHLNHGFRCGIHDRLRTEGFGGCVAYDCFGAGQKVTQVTYQGRDWRASPEIAAQMFEVFGVVRQLQAMLTYLCQALTLRAATPLREELEARVAELERCSQLGPDALLRLDVAAEKAAVNEVLARVSALAREKP